MDSKDFDPFKAAAVAREEPSDEEMDLTTEKLTCMFENASKTNLFIDGLLSMIAQDNQEGFVQGLSYFMTFCFNLGVKFAESNKED